MVRIYEVIPRLPRAISFIKDPDFFEKQVAEEARPAQRSESRVRQVALTRLTALLPFSFFEPSGQECLIAEYDLRFTTGLMPRRSPKPIGPNAYGQRTTLGQLYGWTGNDAPALFDGKKSPALELGAFKRAESLQLYKLGVDNVLDNARKDGTIDKISQGLDDIRGLLESMRQGLGVDPDPAEEERRRDLNRQYEASSQEGHRINTQKEAEFLEMVRSWRRDLIARGSIEA